MKYEFANVEILNKVSFTLENYDEEKNTISGEINFEDANDIFLLLQQDGHISEDADEIDDLTPFESATMEIRRIGDIHVDYHSREIEYGCTCSSELFDSLEEILELMENPSTIQINFCDLEGWEY